MTEVRGAGRRRAAHRQHSGEGRMCIRPRSAVRMGSFLVENGRRKAEKEKPWKPVLLLDCMQTD